MRQPLHGEYLQSQLQAWPWKQLLKGEAAEGDRSGPCSPFFAHGSTLLLPREEGCGGWESTACQGWHGPAKPLCPCPPAAARLPLLSSPQCSIRAALLRSFELASDAIMTVSFTRFPRSCLNVFLSWGLKWQTLWGRDGVPITVPLGLVRCLAKYAGTLRCCCGLNAQQFLQYFYSLIQLCPSLLPPRSTVTFKFCLRGSACFLINERNSASCGFSTNSNQSLPKREFFFLPLPWQTILWTYFYLVMFYMPQLFVYFIKPLK